MSTVAAYARRLAALPRALGILELHPDGLPLSELAAELNVSAEDLREVFLAYYLADLVELGSYSLPVVEFFAPHDDGDRGDADDADDADDAEGDRDVNPLTAQWVRVLVPDPEHELGVDHLTASQLAALYEAGLSLLALEPDNETLAGALAAFESALEPADRPAGPEQGADTAAVLHRAAREHRRVRIRYVRHWQPGQRDRVIDPYRLVRTRRGWEVDAGPADEHADVRTYLVSGIVASEVLDDGFEPPAGLEQQLAANRTPVEVEVVVPQSGRWALERFAESVVVREDDEESVAATISLLPPVEARLGLVLLSCGPDAFVTAPTFLQDAGQDLAGRLLEHHTSEES